jgi:hypothetical protein
VDYDELTTLQDYLGTLLEPDIDPTDVTAYANVYEMLGAQTAAALFDIDDTTSLRVARDGSGGVPVDGDPVGIMMDVSGTGGLTMEAYLSGATELVTNGTFDTDTSGWTVVYGDFASVGGKGVLTYTDASATVSQQLSVEAGKVYQITGSITAATTASPRLKVGSTVGGNDYKQLSAVGSFDIVIVASTATISFYLQNLAAGYVSYDNISVKELPGYVATAPSDAARPTLKTYNSPISSRDVLTTTYSWNITDGGRA